MPPYLIERLYRSLICVGEHVIDRFVQTIASIAFQAASSVWEGSTAHPATLAQCGSGAVSSRLTATNVYLLGISSKFKACAPLSG